ncbi:N-formylglutamate deformylase [Rhodophyticola sp. CCM32]|uniref:N-formylglutamate deformylase n=1 Tax=Rhodophyticola sp. CCM32 TaxID=2916397 RepID=UPI00107F25EA|nr:N-formylglutamate deformylase [Rhodophyticola sp. CCM32]QBY01443.1 N-formylglutamate deformylase [Rhodophyticola sp. CCM32]
MIEVQRGDGPIVLGLPHTGTDVPEAIMQDLNETGRALADTDWHIHQLYDGVLDGVTSVRTPWHRYVIDANRDPGGQSLYPGQNTTGLCPVTDFDGHPIYHEGQEPDASEIEVRRAKYHAPYHAALHAEMDRIKTLHGYAILYDCHSIRGHIPFLFEGQLPDFNIGTNLGTTCDARIAEVTERICAAAQGYSSVTNGRFKGGWTTRYYGRPEDGFHAIQMELSQSTYLTEECAPWAYDTAKANQLRRHLTDILTRIATVIPTGDLT